MEFVQFGHLSLLTLLWHCCVLKVKHEAYIRAKGTGGLYTLHTVDFTLHTNYCCPACVSLRSILKHASWRIWTFYPCVCPFMTERQTKKCEHLIISCLFKSVRANHLYGLCPDTCLHICSCGEGHPYLAHCIRKIILSTMLYKAEDNMAFLSLKQSSSATKLLVFRDRKGMLCPPSLNCVYSTSSSLIQSL